MFDEQVAEKNSERVGFLQARVAGPRKPQMAPKAKAQKEQDGDWNMRSRIALRKSKQDFATCELLHGRNGNSSMLALFCQKRKLQSY